MSEDIQTFNIPSQESFTVTYYSGTIGFYPPFYEARGENDYIVISGGGYEIIQYASDGGRLFFYGNYTLTSQNKKGTDRWFEYTFTPEFFHNSK